MLATLPHFQQGTSSGNATGFFVALAIALILVTVFSRWGQGIARRKGYPIAVGGGLGCLLGPLGVLIMAILPPRAGAETPQADGQAGAKEQR